MPGLSGEVANLTAVLKLDDSNFSGRLARANSQIGSFGRGFAQMGTGVGQVGRGVDKVITRLALVTAAAGAAVFTTAVSFEDSFAGVRKTVEATDAELAELFDSFRKFARETPIAFEDFARIGEIAGALGIATQSIDEFSLAVAKGSTATGLSIDDLADAMGRLGTILKLDESDYETFISTLVELGNKGASTEGEIIEIAKRFAGTAKAAGLANDEILGLSSAISSLGVDPEAAGGSLSRIMTNFITETANASDKAKSFAEVAGLSFKEFSGVVEKDTLGAVLKFVAGLNKLPKLEKFAALEAAGITNTRDRNAIILFASGIEEVNRQLAVSQAEYGKVNALNEEFRKRNETTAARLLVLKNNLRDVGYTIGAELLPVANELITEFLTKMNEPGVQKGIKEFATNLSEGVRGLVRELKGTDFSGILSGLRLTADVAKGAFDAFRALPAPIQQLAIAALIANKVSGGAVGDIAKGLGNIFVGAVKTMLGASLGGTAGGVLGTFLGPGRSVANPLYVFVVNQGIGGGPGGPTVVGGGGGLGGIIKTFLGVGSAVVLGGLIGDAIGRSVFYNPTVQPAVDFETGIINEVIAKQNPEEIARAIRDIEGALQQLDESRFPGGFDLGPISGLLTLLSTQERELLQAQLATLKEQLAVARASAASSVSTSAKLREAGPMGKPKTIPDTAMTPGGTAIKLPNTAMSDLGTTADSTKQLPAIVTKGTDQARYTAASVREGTAATQRVSAQAQTIASRLSEQKGAFLSSFAALREAVRAKEFSAKIPVSVTVNTYVSGTMFAKQHSVTEVASGVRRNTLPT